MTNTMMELMKDIWLNKMILRNNTWQLDGDAEIVDVFVDLDQVRLSRVRVAKRRDRARREIENGGKLY